MQHFQCCAEIFDTFGESSRDHAPCLQAQDRTQPFAAGEYAVAHGAVDGCGMLSGWRQEALQRLVGQALALHQSFAQHGGRV